MNKALVVRFIWHGFALYRSWYIDRPGKNEAGYIMGRFGAKLPAFQVINPRFLAMPIAKPAFVPHKFRFMIIDHHGAEIIFVFHSTSPNNNGVYQFGKGLLSGPAFAPRAAQPFFRNPACPEAVSIFLA